MGTESLDKRLVQIAAAQKKNDRGLNYNSQRRRYGGDIQGIIDKLDYLKDLGISAIYLNPVFHAPSLHKYDAACYNHIDPYFGPDPEADLRIMADEDPADSKTWKWTSADKLFLSLLEKAHPRNMHIIIDGVFNHTGINFWVFKDLKKMGKASKFKDWYTVTSWDDPNTEENEFDYLGWIGVKDLPELKEDENGLIKPVKELDAE